MAETPKSDDRLCRETEEETLRWLSGAEGRPQALFPFEQMFSKRLRAEELRRSARPVVGQLCNFVPDELVLAAGAVPVRLDSGCHVSARRGEEHLPVDVCCAVRAAAGELLSGLGSTPRIDLLVVPTSCDGKRKLASVLARKYEVFTLELPFSNEGDAAKDRWLGEIRRLVKRLEGLTGQKLSRGALRDSIALVNRRTALFRKILEVQQGELLPIRGADVFLVAAASFLADPSWWVLQAEALVRELSGRLAAGQGIRPRARLLLTGSPILWPDFKLLRIIEEAGAEVVADEMCAGTQRLYFPTVLDEETRGGMIRASAEKALLPCTCPGFASNEARLDRLNELLRSARVDAVVHHTLRLCQLYDIDALALASFFRERRVPFLSLHADLGPEEGAALKNRIDALVEMIASAKPK